MPADQLHLVRHGEVDNPHRVVYGRLSGYHLSDLGRLMAEAAAADLVERGRPVTRLLASPLIRTQESAAPLSDAFDLPIETEARVIEPTTRFEGHVLSKAVRLPVNWPYLINPWRPSWGEPYRFIAARMTAAMIDAADSVDSGDVVIVSHQLPIWVAHLAMAGEKFLHDPRARRCTLSSITTFERATGERTSADAAAANAAPANAAPANAAPGNAAPASGTTSPAPFVEVGYVEPAAGLIASATDVGAT